jgi:glutamate/tyrosine decarboxylase-like PLP-dependent enzyme
MATLDDLRTLRRRIAPLEMDPEEFRRLGHALVDRVAGFLSEIRARPVTPGETPEQVRAALGGGGMPAHGADAGALVDRAATLLIEHSLYNGHPRFFGYITSSAAPIGALGDLLASAVNPNVGGWELSPIASEIEAQAVRWIAELLGMPAGSSGLLVSGGNMANFVGFLAARRARADWDVRAKGLSAGPPLTIYASSETHTWLQKAADLFGMGTDAIRWIPTTRDLAMDVGALRQAVTKDVRTGARPFIVVGTAGSVATGAIDPLREIAALCKEVGAWFHVDGAYGGVAALLPDAPADLRALALADSVAVDPHKWLYAPIEAGCTLVRDAAHLVDAFSYRPSYYPMNRDPGAPHNYYEYGLQNTRGFRALKVWLGLMNAGREGLERMIADDIALARALHEAAAAHPELEAFTLGLSIATFRFVPKDLRAKAAEHGEYLDKLNTELLTRLKLGGEAFITNAVISGRYLMRACIVNFRTTLDDVEAVPEIVASVGREVDAELRPR